jgi:hypothetical protein
VGSLATEQCVGVLRGEGAAPAARRSLARARGGMPGGRRRTLHGEFDPGSGRTLAARLTHASRAGLPMRGLERRTGE